MYCKVYLLCLAVLIGMVQGHFVAGVLDRDIESLMSAGFIEYYNLWAGEPDILDAPYTPRVITSFEIGPYQECIEVCRNLRDMYRNDTFPEELDAILLYGPDSHTNTLHVLVYNATAGERENISSYIKSIKNVTVCFREAPASAEMFRRWSTIVAGAADTELNFATGPTLDGKIMILLVDMNPRTVSGVLYRLRDCVPPGILVIRQFTEPFYPGF